MSKFRKQKKFLLYLVLLKKFILFESIGVSLIHYSVDNNSITFLARLFSVSVTFFASAFFIFGFLTYV